MTLQDQDLITESIYLENYTKKHDLGSWAFVPLGRNSMISPKPVLNSAGYVLKKKIWVSMLGTTLKIFPDFNHRAMLRNHYFSVFLREKFVIYLQRLLIVSVLFD